AEEGLRSYAALPLGATAAAAMWEGLDIVPEQLRKALWSGVIFSPRSRSDWNRILPAVAEVGSDGYWTAMQLDREQAADLATMVNRLPVDALILPPEASIASGTVETLRRLYPTILFLEPAGEAIAESVPE
ncbi:MAG: hypothetical protein LIP23_01975, partial [Planctomycetes bacterium]|nr:hypothetical protein [Planctomycetota bacterium]